jgi:nucleotide-binding universal stress UspA family protein
MKGGIIMFAPKRILVPTDFSDNSDEALKQALELAKQYKAKVYLLHVTTPVRPVTVDYGFDTATYEGIENQELHWAQDMMQKELNKFAEFQEIEVISDVREGEPVEEILKEQDEKGVDLIVMPSHSRIGFWKRFMGVISEKVMEEAKSPVLIVHH